MRTPDEEKWGTIPGRSSINRTNILLGLKRNPTKSFAFFFPLNFDTDIG